MKVWCVGVVRKRAVGSGQPENASSSVDEKEVGKGLVGGTAGSDYCDECGSLTSDPRVQQGRVLCGYCAREERLQQTDHSQCDCRKCGGTEDL